VVKHGVGAGGTAEASSVVMAFDLNRRRLELQGWHTSSIGGKELRVLLLDFAGKEFGEQQVVSDRSFTHLLFAHLGRHLYLSVDYFYEALRKSELHLQPTC
jgi:hypothetical protein